LRSSLAIGINNQGCIEIIGDLVAERTIWSLSVVEAFAKLAGIFAGFNYFDVFFATLNF